LAALTDVSFVVPQRSITSLIGPNGAGKTTLFNIISGILRPTEGRVFVSGNDVTGWSPDRIVRLGLTRTWQDIRLFANLTVEENVIVGLTVRRRSGLLDSLFVRPRHRRDRARSRERARELLERLGMYDKRGALPTEISYGYRKRVEIARALASDPNVLVLDEPTAGLRAREANDLVSLIGQLAADLRKTVLLIEHNMAVVASVSHQIVVLNFGRKIADGEAASVLGDPAVIDAYLGSPLETDAGTPPRPTDMSSAEGEPR